MKVVHSQPSNYMSAISTISKPHHLNVNVKSYISYVQKVTFHVPFTGNRPRHRACLYRCFHYGPPEEKSTSELGANLFGWLPSTERKILRSRSEEH